jgi:hypothetical protein
MNEAFRILETSRTLYSKLLENYSLEQLNTIPEGFSNNLVWNAGHVIASQQKLIYALSGFPMKISDDFFEKYRNGSRPDAAATHAEVAEIKHLLLSTAAQVKADYENNVFQKFNEYQTQTGFYLGNLKEAILFNNYHEGIHLGMMLTIRKFI